MSSSSDEKDYSVIDVPTSLVFLSMVPVLLLAGVSSVLNLDLERPLCIGVLRTYVQLTILGFILHPIFVQGTDWWILVLLYTLFMIVLASYESAARSQYTFAGLFKYVLACFMGSVGLVSLFAFGVIIRPTPVWEPQYVIPIVGMLLGNCINGAALAMDSILTGLVEQAHEIELYLSFGATAWEATERLAKHSVRVGAMPPLNSMAVIGLITIPGMMTGQILGGSPVMEAAKYQMIICYWIVVASFLAIWSQVWMARALSFDKTGMLLPDFLTKAPPRKTLWDWILTMRSSFSNNNHDVRQILPTNSSGSLEDCEHPNDESQPMTSTNDKHESSSIELIVLASRGPVESESKTKSANMGDLLWSETSEAKTREVELPTIDSQPNSARPNLDVRNLSRSFHHQTLFRNLSIEVPHGTIVGVRGPSGSGKTQFLRLIAGLSPTEEGEIYLDGIPKHQWDKNPTHWRDRIRYVSQYKVDIPGTPLDFMHRITSFQSWRVSSMPSLLEMQSTCGQLIQSWGLEPSTLEKEWKVLSGGEAQRVLLAMAVASRPQVLLLDESTSALDILSKTRVEQSIRKVAMETGVSVLWITHDQEQMERLRQATDGVSL